MRSLARSRLAMGIFGSVIASLAMATTAQAEDTVAYCDSTHYAINVYRNTAADDSDSALNVRVFWREKAIVFADLPAQESSFAEGTTYTSRSGLSEDYNDSLWTLFLPHEEGQACLLFRNGAAFTSGSVTQRPLNPVDSL